MFCDLIFCLSGGEDGRRRHGGVREEGMREGGMIAKKNIRAGLQACKKKPSKCDCVGGLLLGSLVD